MTTFEEHVQAVAEEKGLLTGRSEHDERVLNRLWWHFAVVSA